MQHLFEESKIANSYSQRLIRSRVFDVQLNESAEIYNAVTNSASEFTEHEICLVVILRVLTSDSTVSASRKAFIIRTRFRVKY